MVSDGNWVWRDAGPFAYFGIPLSNFAGWLVTAFAIYLVWLWIEGVGRRLQPGLSRVDAAIERLATAGITRQLARPLRSPAWDSLPVYIYIITWLGESIVNVVLWHTPLVGLAVFIGMGVFSLPALARLWQTYSTMWLTIGQSLRSLVQRSEWS